MRGKYGRWLVPVILIILPIITMSACAQNSPAAPGAPAPATTSVTTPPRVTPETQIPVSAMPLSPVNYADEAFNGKEIQMVLGSTLQVALNSNPTTGFKWELAQISDAAVLEKVNSIFETPMVKQKEGSPPIVGAGGKEFWTFKALKRGTAVISMEYSRPWEGGEKGVNKFSLTVTVQ
jgi:inhibitor of cysteine peptidase